MPILQTEAITLRRRRTREADALVILFCRDGGKIVASTKSVMKTSSRYAGVTEPFNHLHVMLYAKTESQEIQTLTQVSLIKTFDLLRTDITRMAFAYCLVEWVDFLSDESQSNHRIWTLLLNAFNRWSDNVPKHEDLFFYQWQLLIDAGLAPRIQQCLKTGETDTAKWMYQAQAGGIVKATLAERGHLIHHGSIQVLRRFSQAKEPPAIKLSTQQIQEIETLLQQHLEYHVGMRSKANLFLNQWKTLLQHQQ